MSPMKQLTKITNDRFHGEFTLMNLDGYWRCSLGAMAWHLDPEVYDKQIEYMSKGKTMNEAIENCIKEDNCIFKIQEKIDGN